MTTPLNPFDTTPSIDEEFLKKAFKEGLEKANNPDFVPEEDSFKVIAKVAIKVLFGVVGYIFAASKENGE